MRSKAIPNVAAQPAWTTISPNLCEWPPSGPPCRPGPDGRQQLPAIPPVLFQHSPNLKIDPTVIYPLRFPEHALVAETQFSRDGATTRIPCTAADLHAMEALLLE